MNIWLVSPVFTTKYLINSQRLYCVGHFERLKYWTDTSERRIPCKEFFKFSFDFKSVSYTFNLKLYSAERKLNCFLGDYTSVGYFLHGEKGELKYWDCCSSSVVFLYFHSRKKIARIYSALHIYFVTKKYNEKIELMIPFGKKGLKFSPDL